MSFRPVTDAQRYAWEERASILEYECGLTRQAAEAEAARQMSPPEQLGFLVASVVAPRAYVSLPTRAA